MKLLKCLALFALILSLNACSGDDDINPNDSGIVGTWTMTELTYSGSSVNNVGSPPITTTFTGVGKDMDTTITFDEDKSYSSIGNYTIALTYSALGQTYEQDTRVSGFLSNGIWDLVGDQLTITDSNGETSTTTIILDDDLVVNISLENVLTQSGASTVETIDASYRFVKQ